MIILNNPDGVISLYKYNFNFNIYYNYILNKFFINKLFFKIYNKLIKRI